ncbi:MAG: YcxB family protein [Gemmatimonadota bacterium]
MRERWYVVGRKLFRPSTLVLVALCAALCVAAVSRHAPVWWLLFAGACPAIMLIVAAIWLSGLWWYPRAIRRRLARLAHRRVTIDFTIAGLTFQTAVERLEIAWSELRSIQPLPQFWLLRLRSGAEIPVPRAELTPELMAEIRTLLSSDVFNDGYGDSRPSTTGISARDQ